MPEFGFNNLTIRIYPVVGLWLLDIPEHGETLPRCPEHFISGEDGVTEIEVRMSSFGNFITFRITQDGQDKLFSYHGDWCIQRSGDVLDDKGNRSQDIYITNSQGSASLSGTLRMSNSPVTGSGSHD